MFKSVFSRFIIAFTLIFVISFSFLIVIIRVLVKDYSAQVTSSRFESAETAVNSAKNMIDGQGIATVFNRYAEQIAIAKETFGLADNAPGVYSLMNVASVREFSGMGLYLGIASALIVAAALIRSRRKMTNEILLLAGLLLACGLPLILPQMNARSLYLAGMLAFCCAGNARRFAVAVVLEVVSLCSYMQSIFNVTIMPMSVLSLIAIAIAAVVAVDLITLIMTPEEAETDSRRNVLLQCVGASDAVYPDMFFGETAHDAIYMLCSDGFRHEITSEEIFEKLQPSVVFDDYTMQQNTISLIELNKQRRERDNITVALVRTF